MATWNQLNAEVRALGTTFYIVRRKYPRNPADRTGRNMVLLYSSWLDGPGIPARASATRTRSG